MNNVSWIDFLKLRASFGIINADYLPASDVYDYWDQIYTTTGTRYMFNSAYDSSFGTTELSRLASTNYTHEKGYKYVITSDGNIKSLRFEEKDIINDSKLFDVIIDIVDKNYTFHRIYMSLKYTKENGGMQDNVRTEIIDTYKYCLKNNDENTIFMFMLDGDYWNSNKNGELITNTNKIYRVNSKTFKNTISEIIKNF